MKGRVAFYILLGAVGLLSAAMLLPLFIPVMVAIILGYLLLPVYDRMAWALRSADLRAALLVLLVLFVVALPVLLIVMQVVEEIPGALRSADLSQAVEKVNQWLDAMLGRHIPLSENLTIYMGRVRDATLRAAPRIIGAIGNTALGLFVLLYTLYYVLRDGRLFWQNFLLILPLEDAVKPLLTLNLKQTLGAVIYGQFITALVQGSLAGIGYVVFHVPHALLWTLVTTTAAMIPVVGATAVWLPLAISRLAVGDKVGGIGLLIYGGVVVMNIDNVLKPRLIAGRAQLHPLVALLGVIGGIYVFGVIGFVLGPVLLGLVVAMLKFHRDVALQQAVVVADGSSSPQVSSL